MAGFHLERSSIGLATVRLATVHVVDAAATRHACNACGWLTSIVTIGRRQIIVEVACVGIPVDFIRNLRDGNV